MATVYVGIGSNVDPLKYIRAGMAALRARYTEVWTSSVYETKAIGFEGRNFYNLVVGFETDEDVFSVDKALTEIERDNGRTKIEKHFGDRTLDLDLLLYDDLCSTKCGLKLPRKDIVEYAYTLLPLAEIAPSGVHPVLGQRYDKMWESFEDKAAQPLTKLDIQV
ncbi:MAG: 2-amino-4-hydroxy-6-hydroxymethyldihydropteridine diphosphokinase [Pseudomonadota bacterium]